MTPNDYTTTNVYYVVIKELNWPTFYWAKEVGSVTININRAWRTASVDAAVFFAKEYGGTVHQILI